MTHQTWILITGATSPLGVALARTFSAAGYSILLHYKTNQQLALELQEECSQALILQGDFSTPEGVEKFLENYRATNVCCAHLIHNASLYALGTLIETPSQLVRTLFQVNLHAPLTITQTLIPDLKQQQGSILMLGVAGLDRLQANLHHTAYHLTKQALWRATRSLAKELASEQIRVNMLSPGHLPHSKDLLLFESLLPTKSPTPLQSVAEVALFLLSKQAEAILGQNIEVSAGALL